MRRVSPSADSAERGDDFGASELRCMHSMLCRSDGGDTSIVDDFIATISPPPGMTCSCRTSSIGQCASRVIRPVPDETRTFGLVKDGIRLVNDLRSQFELRFRRNQQPAP